MKTTPNVGIPYMAHGDMERLGHIEIDEKTGSPSSPALSGDHRLSVVPFPPNWSSDAALGTAS